MCLACVSLHAHACAYMHAYMCICMCACVHAYVHVCAYVYVRVFDKYLTLGQIGTAKSTILLHQQCTTGPISLIFKCIRHNTKKCREKWNRHHGQFEVVLGHWSAILPYQIPCCMCVCGMRQDSQAARTSAW